ncbi:hypothetical protein [Streptacidiphilus pinicola]|uniref:hypothetical protein n=1 Tax=Streptacidiphilus pinicola TaxID=2219663 RepID=UPI0010579D7B|nr:hypothetical protein [Streptacidiphilus pinicola]
MAATGLSCLGAVTGASAADAEAYPPGGGPFVVSTTLVISGGRLTFTATLPFGEPIVVELALPTLPALPGPSPSGSPHADVPKRHDRPPQTLATLVPDAHGHVCGSVTIPAGTAPGDHLLMLATTKSHHVLAATPLQVLSSASGGTASARVGVEDTAQPPVQTRQAQQFTRPLLAAGAMTVGTGLGGWALRRRRPRHDD